MKRPLARKVIVRLSGAAGRGAELDPVISTLFPKDSLVTGVVMKQCGVAPAEGERMEFWIELAGRGEVELHARVLTLTHCNGKPLLSGAAEKEGMVLLENVVAMFSREEADDFPRETSEAWNSKAEEGKRKRPNSRKATASMSMTPAMERMAVSTLK